MKTSIRLPISSHATVLVGVGDKVENHAILAHFPEKQVEIIPLSDLLHIAPKHIMRTLKKEIGAVVAAGDILAEKKGLFSLLSIKSPFAAKFTEVDLKRGTLTLALIEGSEKQKELTTPFAGKVLHVTDSYIEIETEGQLFKLQKGSGEEVDGELLCFSHESVEMFDIHPEVSDKIVLMMNLTSGVLAKLDALGVKGILFHKKLDEEIEKKITWGQVEKEVYTQIKEHNGKVAWLYPAEKQIVVLE